MSRRTAGIALGILLTGFGIGAAGELADFVARSDPATRWQKQSERSVGSSREIDAELVSQTWRGIAWRHELRVVVPASLAPLDVAVLIIGGDASRGAVDERRLAEEAGAITAYLRSVPNQPLFGESEDALIAYSFERYLRTRDADWPLLFPMTKAAVKAMDAVTDLVGGAVPRKFVVTGASKRGWTTWLVAVADHRVAAIAPMVFDNLDFGAQMRNQMAVWGRYSNMLGDYTERSLQALIGTERGRELVSMVDPFAYRAALTPVSKLVVNGSNDPYWELGAVDFYWKELGGPKALLCVPNAGHDAGSDARSEATLVELVRRVGASRSMPALSTSDIDDGRTAIASDEAPRRVLLWRTESASRDFRSARWRATEVRRQGDRFVADAMPASDRFTAWFVEAEYPSAGRSFTLSTPVRISSPQTVESRQ
ncbi:MAG: PhoPQ-activated protein PqaA family protein [Candidatus Binatia bacterium]